jgi:hypothetical protein
MMTAVAPTRAHAGNGAAATGRRPRATSALALLFGAGVLIRVGAMATFWPAWYVNQDSIGYATAATGADKFAEVGHPAGYPYFLAFLHAVADRLALVALAQHALGIATAALLYLAVRRLGGSRPVAAVPAAVALLGGDQLFFEHAILSEALFAFLVAAAVYAFARASDGGGASGPGGGASDGDAGPPPPTRRRRIAWLAVAGATLGLAVCVREVAIFLVPLMLGWTLWRGAGRLRMRALEVAFTAVAVLAPVALYIAVQHDQTGYTGLARTAGWSAYARTAQFADCTQFTPPRGTTGLCERRPSRDRPGPTYYHWLPASPAVRLFGFPPAGDAALGRFGHAAMVHQPGAYLSAVAGDELRYFGLRLGVDRPDSGTGPNGLTFGTGGHFRAAATAAFAPHYGDVDARTAPASNALRAYQQVVRVHPPLVALLLALSIAGLVLCTGRRRAAIVLFGGTAVVTMAVPPAVLVWSWRYGVPAQPLLVASAAFGFDELQRRVRARRSTSPERMNAAVDPAET